MTESFATAIRGTAIGGAYNVGRLGAALAPATIGFLASGGSIGLGFVVMGAAYLICGVIPALFIKEKYTTLKSRKEIHHKNPIGSVPIGLMVLTI